AVHRNAQDVEVLLVAGIDADLAEVHRPRVEAVDTRPRFAAVGGLVDAAVFVAVGALLVLGVGPLTAVHEAVRPQSRRPARAAASAALGRRLHGVDDFLRFLIAQHLQRYLVVRLLVPDRVDVLLERFGFLLINALYHVVRFEASLVGGGVRHDAQ